MPCNKVTPESLAIHTAMEAALAGKEILCAKAYLPYSKEGSAKFA